jgi:hypothetical protein
MQFVGFCNRYCCRGASSLVLDVLSCSKVRPWAEMTRAWPPGARAHYTCIRYENTGVDLDLICVHVPDESLSR